MAGMRIEHRLAELGLELPPPMKLPPGLALPFPWVRLWAVLELWGPDAGPRARSAIGVAELPFGIPVEIEAEVAFAS
jgi:hypothetical protein